MGVCITDLGTWTSLNCANDLLKGSSNAIAFLAQDHGITDYSNETQWDTAIAETDISKKAWVIKKWLKVSVEPGSHEETDSPDRVVGGTLPGTIVQPITWEDYNISSTNDGFYEKSNGRIFTMAIAEPKNSQVRVYKNVTVKILPPNLSVENNEKLFYSGTGTWESEPGTFPVRADMPANIFTVKY